MKSVIIGGAGFVGSHIAERLANDGHEVHVLDNLSRAELLKKKIFSDYNWNYLRRHGKVNLLKADIRALDSVKDVFRDAELVVHTAAQPAVTTSITDPMTDFQINAMGTLSVLEKVRLLSDNAALVFCSTNKVYGDNVNRLPLVEKKTRYEFKNSMKGVPPDFPTDNCKHSPYGCSKLAGDTYVQEYGKTYGMHTCVFRMSCIYGTRQYGVEDQGWVSWFAIAMATGKKLTIYGDGKQVRDILYVDDLVEAVLKFKRRSTSFKGEVLNMGGGPRNTISLLELISFLQQMGLSRPKISFAEWRKADQKVYVSDISKAEKWLEWKPKIGVREGVSRTCNWITQEMLRQ